jgi:DNA polymerase-3 subunit delta
MVDMNNDNGDTVHNHYLLLSDELLLVNNKIDELKKILKIDESFDLEVCSIQDYEYSEIINKILTPPFISQKRMLILKNLEKKNLKDLEEFAHILPRIPKFCCLITVYMIDKKRSARQKSESFNKLRELFPNARSVILMPDKTTVQRWIVKKLESLGLEDRHDIVDYLVEEFSDDVTGLKNEIQKIENYLYQTKQLGFSEAKDILGVLPEYDVYKVAKNFFQRHKETLRQLVSLLTYLRTPVILVDALGQTLSSYARNANDEKIIRYLTGELLRIDSRLKTGSDFGDILLEILFIKNLLGVNKGAIYGK